MDQLVDKKGAKTGDIKDLGGTWWLVSTQSAEVDLENKDKKSFCASGSASLEFSHEAKAVGEATSSELTLKGLALSANTPAVAGIKIGPGPNIEYDQVKGKLVTNSAIVNTITRIELTTAEQRALVSRAKAAIALIEKSTAVFENAGAYAEITQRIQTK